MGAKGWAPDLRELLTFWNSLEGNSSWSSVRAALKSQKILDNLSHNYILCLRSIFIEAGSLRIHKSLSKR